MILTDFGRRRPLDSTTQHTATQFTPTTFTITTTLLEHVAISAALPLEGTHSTSRSRIQAQGPIMPQPTKFQQNWTISGQVTVI